MSKKKPVQEVRLCRDCRHAKPVTHEYLTPDGKPIFCTCDFKPYYHSMNYSTNPFKFCNEYESNTLH